MKNKTRELKDLSREELVEIIYQLRTNMEQLLQENAALQLKWEAASTPSGSFAASSPYPGGAPTGGTAVRDSSPVQGGTADSLPSHASPVQGEGDRGTRWRGCEQAPSTDEETTPQSPAAPAPLTQGSLHKEGNCNSPARRVTVRRREAADD